MNRDTFISEALLEFLKMLTKNHYQCYKHSYVMYEYGLKSGTICFTYTFI